MSIYKNSPPIVTNGLVLHLDAGNSKSYTSGSSTWYDLSGQGNNGTLVGSGSARPPQYVTTNGGGIYNSGSSYMQINSNAISNVASDLTVEISTDNGGYFVRGYSSGLWSIQYSGANSSAIVTTSTGNNQHTTTPTYSQTTNNLISAMVFKQGTGLYHYANGVLVGQILFTATTLRGTSGNDLNIYLGYFAVGSYFTPSTYYGCKIYNRALSPQEVSQNYNALKSRFNLT